MHQERLIKHPYYRGTNFYCTSVMSPYGSSARSGRRQQASRTALYLMRVWWENMLIGGHVDCFCLPSLYSSCAYLSWSCWFPNKMFSFRESLRIQACCDTYANPPLAATFPSNRVICVRRRGVERHLKHSFFYPSRHCVWIKCSKSLKLFLLLLFMSALSEEETRVEQPVESHLSQ